MSLERLLSKIEEDAETEAEEILAAARTEAERIREQGEREAHRVYESIRSSFRERAQRERLKILSMARMESRLQLLAAKDAILEETNSRAIVTVEEMPEQDYRSLLKAIILRGAASGREEIIPSSFDRRILEEGLLRELNETLKEGGRRGELTLSREVAPVKRGVILREGKVETNLSFEAILREVWERYEEEILRTIFAE
jgi:V/A-type H+-transporting ATPase subunit E